MEGVSESLPSGSTIVDQPSYPIQIYPRGVQVRDVMGRERLYHHRTGIGAIYLVPRTEERLHLVVWGYDKKGLQQAARLTPGLTGVGQPDFAVLGPECSWKGAGGVLAMGFFDYDWSISSSSYIS